MDRPYRPEDLEGLLRLWREVGGWFRATLPVTDSMAEAAFRELGRKGWRGERGHPSRSAWVVPSSEGFSAALYARRDPDLSYVVPLVRAGPSAAADLERLLASAESWFREIAVRQYRVEAPVARRDLAQVLTGRGTSLWRRAVYGLPAGAASVPPAGTSVRPYARADRAALSSLAERRLPHGRPDPAPIPFLDARAPSFLPFTEPTGTSAWVLREDARLVGVAGATRFLAGGSAEVGPFLLDREVAPSSAVGLLGAPIAWLRSLGVGTVRASVPQGFEREERALHDAGFVPLAEGDVVEVALG
jgi:hypothetical protein